MFPRTITAALVLGGTVLAGTASVQAETLSYNFNINLGIAKIGEMRVEATEEGGSYTTSAMLRTTGVAGALYNVRYDYEARGNAANHWALQPTRFFSRSSEDGRTSTLEMNFSGNRLVRLKRNGAEAAVPDLPAGTLDPMTLIYVILRPVAPENVCGGTYVLYDGGVKYDVSFRNARRSANGRVSCDVSYGGGGNNRGVAVSGISYVPGSDGRLHVQSFSAGTTIGTLKATRR